MRVEYSRTTLEHICNNIGEYFFDRTSSLTVSNNDLEIEASPLWKKIDAIMTDAVTKKLKIEQTIAKELNCDHVPLHLLCKSHTVEGLDRSNIEVLADIEKSVKQQEIFEKMNPAKDPSSGVKKQLWKQVSKHYYH